MRNRNRLTRVWRNHGTKVVGFTQVTAGVLATSTVMPPKAAGWVALIGGLITAWRGYTNSAAPPQGPTS